MTGADPVGLHTEVAAAVIIVGKRVLVQTRPAGRRYAGWWEFPGGKLDPGESVEACAVRECSEELDLAVTAAERVHVEEWAYPGARVRVTFVVCTPESDRLDGLRAVEGQRLHWADAADLRSLRFLPANEKVLVRVAERLLAAE